MIEDIWIAEQRLWVEGVEAYEELLHPECLMVFAPPIGIIGRETIVDSLRNAPRWLHVKMRDQALAQTDGSTVVIAYRAEAHRDQADAYHAYCSSTYTLAESRRRLIQHQQTQISAEMASAL